MNKVIKKLNIDNKHMSFIGKTIFKMLMLLMLLYLLLNTVPFLYFDTFSNLSEHKFLLSTSTLE